MNRLIAIVMLATLAAIGIQLARGDAPRWVGWASLILAASAILLAGIHTVPSAVRLGRGATAPAIRPGSPARSSVIMSCARRRSRRCW